MTAFSGAVFVSACELAKWLSSAAAIDAACDGSLTLTTYQLTLPLPARRFSSKYS